MTKTEIKNKIDSGCKIKVTFGLRKCFYYIQVSINSFSYSEISKKQFDYAKSLCNKCIIETIGFTNHYHWKE